MPYEMPSRLREAIKAFIEYYNYERYHQGLGDVTPSNLYTRRNLEVIQRRKEAKNRTLKVRREYNRIIREQGKSLWSIHHSWRSRCPTFADYIQLR